MNSSDCRAWKILWNDTKLELFYSELNVENLLFNFCVGVWVGGSSQAKFECDRRYSTNEQSLFCDTS